MRRVVSAFVLATCLAIGGAAAPAARAQFGGVAVTFHNNLQSPVIVQGCTVVNGMKKFGMAIIVRPGKTATDNNIPANSIRFYRIVDANRPALQYVPNLPVPVGLQDINLTITGVPPKVFVKAVP